MGLRSLLYPGLTAVGGVVTPLGDIPSFAFLMLSGVTNPGQCLQSLKGEATWLPEPCAPLTELSGLPFISDAVVFIAILLIGWVIVDLRQSKSS